MCVFVCACVRVRGCATSTCFGSGRPCSVPACARAEVGTECVGVPRARVCAGRRVCTCGRAEVADWKLLAPRKLAGARAPTLDCSVGDNRGTAL